MENKNTKRPNLLKQLYTIVEIVNVYDGAGYDFRTRPLLDRSGNAVTFDSQDKAVNYLENDFDATGIPRTCFIVPGYRVSFNYGESKNTLK